MGSRRLPDAPLHLLFQSQHNTEKVQKENPMNNIYVELSESLDRIEVRFRYDADDINKIKTIKGKRWDPEQKLWTVPMEMKTAKLLRELFGDRLQLGEALRLWAKDAQRTERRLRRLTNSDDAALQKVTKVIADVIAGRPIEHPSNPAGHAL